MVDVDLAITTVAPTPTTEELELGRGADKARRVPLEVVSGHPPRGFHPPSRHMPYCYVQLQPGGGPLVRRSLPERGGA